ncbi:MAG: sulfite exporter TauE/SafE family protein [bacterium]
MFLIILLAGLVTQLVAGTLGMGFGVTTTSLLLTLGFSTALASAAVHTAETLTSFMSGMSHLLAGNVEKKIVIPLTFSGMAGGVTGVYVSVNLQHTEIVKPFVAFFLLIMGGLIAYRFATKNHEFEHCNPGRKKLVPLGFVAALIDALCGGGWGPIATPTLIMFNSHPRKAIGSVNLSSFFITATIAVSFFVMLPKIDWRVVVPLVIGGAISAPFAAHLTKKLPIKVLGISVGALIMILSIRTIFISL